MYRELSLRRNSTMHIAEAIMALDNSEYPLLIRSHGENRSRQYWHDFLRDQCGLSPDRRHFQSNESLSTADWWEISYQPDKASTYAYSKTAQPFHNDNAWFADPAEINFFVMEKQAVAGGEQIIYPVSRIISDLAESEPSLLHDLCTIPVTIKKGNGVDENTTPILIPGEKAKIFWNFYRTIKNSSAIETMCKQFFDFLAKKEESSSTYKLRCDSGDCLVIHDQKMLHARSSFSATNPKDRILFQSMWRLPRHDTPQQPPDRTEMK